MSSISNDFILGALIGYFLQNYPIIFILGLVSGIFIVEKYGSVKSMWTWLFTHSVDNFREIATTYIKRKPIVIEKRTEEKKTEEKLD
jgi:hypothetical protein